MIMSSTKLYLLYNTLLFSFCVFFSPNIAGSFILQTCSYLVYKRNKQNSSLGTYIWHKALYKAATVASLISLRANTLDFAFIGSIKSSNIMFDASSTV